MTVDEAPWRVEKHKWDGSTSAVEPALLVDVSAAGHPAALAWFVAAGTDRDRPRKGEVEHVERDELWATTDGAWWVLCAVLGDDAEVDEYVLHAAVPVQRAPDVLRWVDLDLDLEVHGDEIEVQDEAEFHEHARSMQYPDDVIRGAWSGISEVASRYTTGEWPFDGWVEGVARAIRGA